MAAIIGLYGLTPAYTPVAPFAFSRLNRIEGDPIFFALALTGAVVFSYMAMTAPMTCPRSGAPVVQRPGRGRPRRWCSDRCRTAETLKRAHARARRAAASRTWTTGEIAGMLAERT